MKEQELINALETYMEQMSPSRNYAHQVLSQREGEVPKMKKKAAFSLVMAFVLMFLAVATAYALLPRKTTYDTFGSWSYLEGTLYYQTPDDKRATPIVEDENILFLSADDQMLYYVTKGEKGKVIRSVMNNGLSLYPERAINTKYNVRDFQMGDGTAYILAHTNQGKGVIYALHPMDSSIPDWKLQGKGWENINNIAFCIHEDMLYAYSTEDGGTLASLSIGMDENCHTTLVPGLSSLCYGYEKEGEDHLFALSEGKLVIVNAATGAKYDTGEKLPSGAAQVVRNHTSIFVNDDEGSLLTSYDANKLSGQRELRRLYVVNDVNFGHGTMADALPLFHEKYPDVEVVPRQINDSRKLATELMAGNNCDIYLYGDFDLMPTYAELLKNGAVIELTHEPDFEALWDDYRDVWPMMSSNGRQYGWIYNYTVHLMWANPEIAAQIGWEIPTGVWTYADFDTLTEKVIAYNKTAEAPIFLMPEEHVHYFLSNFDALHVDYYQGTHALNSDAHVDMLRRIVYLKGNNLLSTEKFEDFGKHAKLAPNTLMQFCSVGGLGSMGDKTMLLPPVENAQNPRYTFQTQSFLISANSPMKEEAVYLLACMAHPEIEGMGYNGQMLKDKSRYLIRDNSQAIALGIQKPLSEQNEYLLNFALEHAVVWDEALEVTRAKYGYYDTSDNPTIFEMLLNGSLSPEEYAAIRTEQMNMYLGE
mgnify:FL=1